MPIGTDAPPAATAGPRRRAALALALVSGTGLVLMGLFAASEATVAADGTLIEPFGALALGTLALTVAGLLGLARLFGGIRRSGACGRGTC